MLRASCQGGVRSWVGPDDLGGLSQPNPPWNSGVPGSRPRRQAAPSVPAAPPLPLAGSARPLAVPARCRRGGSGGRCVPDAGPGGCRAPGGAEFPLPCAPPPLPPPPPLRRAPGRPRPPAGSRPGPAAPRAPGLRGGGGRRVKAGPGRDAGPEPVPPPPGQGERALRGGWRARPGPGPQVPGREVAHRGGLCHRRARGLALVTGLRAERGGSRARLAGTAGPGLSPSGRESEPRPPPAARPLREPLTCRHQSPPCSWAKTRAKPSFRLSPVAGDFSRIIRVFWYFSVVLRVFWCACGGSANSGRNALRCRVFLLAGTCRSCCFSVPF